MNGIRGCGGVFGDWIMVINCLQSLCLCPTKWTIHENISAFQPAIVIRPAKAWYANKKAAILFPGWQAIFHPTSVIWLPISYSSEVQRPHLRSIPLLILSHCRVLQLFVGWKFRLTWKLDLWFRGCWCGDNIETLSRVIAECYITSAFIWLFFKNHWTSPDYHR